MKRLLRKLYIKLFNPYEIIDRQLVDGTEANRLILDEGYVLSGQYSDELLEQNLVWVEKRWYITE